MEKFKEILLHPLTITLLIILLGVGGVFGLIKLSSKAENRVSAPVVERYWGKADAKVVVTEYGDFQCPGCANFYSTVEKRLKTEYSDKIKFVYKHFPLGIHPNAQRAGEAAEAAGAQGKFWEYHDYLFDHQSEAESWTNSKLTEYAGALGLDTEKFKKELSDGVYKKAVRETRDEATDAGYTGTPTILLNNQRVNVSSYDEFVKQINELLGDEAPLPSPSPTAITEATPIVTPDEAVPSTEESPE